MSGGGAPEEFSCANVEEYFAFGEKLIASLGSAFNSSTNVFECVGDIIMQAGQLLEDASK